MFTWIAWCHQCQDEWHAGLTPEEVVAFANTHMHPGIKCMPDFLLDQLTSQVFAQAEATLSSKGE